MNKNLFLISESEKSRILNMHKKATNSQYLGEQAATPAPAAAVPTELKSVADIQNFLISKGFDVGKTGADGKMGKDTIAALGKFMSGSGGTTAAATPEATKAGATTGATTTTSTTGTTAQNAAQAAAPTTPAAQAATPTTSGTQPVQATDTTNVPLASRKDIRQQNRQVRQDQRTLNRMGGKMTPEQQRAYQQSIANRTGISK